MKYKLLQQLLPYIEEYEKQCGKNNQKDVHDFAFWLSNSQKETLQGTSVNEDFAKTQNFKAEQGVEIMIAKLISHLYKYAKGYSKKILAGTPLKTLDDFGYMAALMVNSKMSKSDLIHQNINEITSGAEVLKRLLKAGLIEEWKDNTDKRKKNVHITPSGYQLMLGVFKRMNTLSHLISGNLTHTEKQYLYRIMQKLDVFHRNIQNNESKTSIDELMQKYIVS